MIRFGQIFEKFFWSKFSKNFHLLKLGQSKFSILVKFRKFFYSKFSKNFDLVEIFEKFRVSVKSSEKIFEVKYSKISKNVDLGLNFRIFSILVKIFEKFKFWSHFRKFWSNYRKKFDFSKNFREFQKCRFW